MDCGFIWGSERTARRTNVCAKNSTHVGAGLKQMFLLQFFVSYYRASTATISCLLLQAVMIASGISAHAQARLEAQYQITMARVPIGYIDWHVEIENDSYVASADGKASRILSVLMNGEGSVLTNGRIENGQLAPTYFLSNITDDDGKTEVQVIFASGIAEESILQEPSKRHKLAPVTNLDRRRTTDPLSAMLIPANARDGILEPANCTRALPIFDGQRRYDLVLTYKRMDNVKIERGYSGRTLVCGAILQPIGGYRIDSLVVKYIAGRRDMELWFAPIIGTFVMAPVQIIVPTLIGTLIIQADKFESVPISALHVPAPSNGSPR
jgi:hypothetical protein